MAAMPSVHVAAAVLVGLAIRTVAPRLSVVGIGYALAMSLAVVYLGEHFVVDAVAGMGDCLARLASCAEVDVAVRSGLTRKSLSGRKVTRRSR